jgi:lipopolysaccharide export system protein LptA
MTQRLWLYAVLVALAAPGPVAAQSPRAGTAAPAPPPSFLQNENQDQPIQIDAATLEVHDKNKMATFSGDVVVVQGDTTIKCQTLVVFYGPEHGGAKQAANAPQATQQNPQPQQQQAGGVPTRQQDIRRIEARGGVTVISKDQNASGDLGVYDLKKKTITLTGNVVDTTTGNAHFDTTGSATPNSRVRALILPSKNENGGPSNLMSIGPPKAN